MLRHYSLNLALRREGRPPAVTEVAHHADAVFVKLEAPWRSRSCPTRWSHVIEPQVNGLELDRCLQDDGRRVARLLHRQASREVRSQRDHRCGVRVIVRIPGLVELTARIPVVHVAVAGIVDVRAAPVVLNVAITGEASLRVDADVCDASGGEVVSIVAKPLLPIHPREWRVCIVNGVYVAPFVRISPRSV